MGASFNPSSNLFDFDDAYEIFYHMSTCSSLSLTEWLAHELVEFGGSGAVTGINADLNGDGVANILEYALDDDPGKQDPASTVPTVLVGEGGIVIEYASTSRAYGFRNFNNYRLRVIAQCG